METYLAVVDTLILIMVALETYFTWRYMQHKNRERIKRSVRNLLHALLPKRSSSLHLRS